MEEPLAVRRRHGHVTSRAVLVLIAAVALVACKGAPPTPTRLVGAHRMALAVSANWKTNVESGSFSAPTNPRLEFFTPLHRRGGGRVLRRARRCLMASPGQRFDLHALVGRSRNSAPCTVWDSPWAALLRRWQQAIRAGSRHDLERARGGCHSWWGRQTSLRPRRCWGQSGSCLLELACA